MLIVIHYFGQIKLNVYRVSTELWVASGHFIEVVAKQN